jgi:two-component system, LytTR family, response regulator
MRVLVVDDEPLAREALTRILADRSEIEDFDVAEGPQAALTLLRAHRHDVMLLDIHMPELSGLELVQRLRERDGPLPVVVFVTAYDEHAVEAFEKRAVDYVLKPFRPERVHSALDAALSRSEEARTKVLVDLLRSGDFRPKAGNRMALRDKGRVLFIDIPDIVSAEAQGNYVLLRSAGGNAHLLRETLTAVAEKLRTHGFLRVHRSILVNSQHVESVQSSHNGDLRLRTTLGTEYHVARSYRASLRKLAVFWIGAD